MNKNCISLRAQQMGESEMKKFCIGLLSFASLVGVTAAFAEEASPLQVPVTTPQAAPQPTASNFTAAQLLEIEKTVASYLTKNPTIITDSFQAAMEAQQKETVAKMEKAVADNKDKIFKNAMDPTSGNVKGSKSLVVFMDPYCGYCKKFHGELATLLNTNKDVKVIFKDIPIMGEDSTMAIQAMLAAKAQGKYEQLQNAVFSADKHLTKKQLMKIAKSLGIDTNKLQEAMKSKEIQAEVDQNLELAKALNINGTPTLIVNETQVVPGFVAADDLNKKLQGEPAPADTSNTKAS